MWQKLKNIFHLFIAISAVLYYRYPAKKLTVIGVTGTDGKTTTSTLIASILEQAGYKTSLITSIGARIGSKELDTGFHVTTPSPWQVQKFLAQAVKVGCKFMVLETTSHAIDQNRVFGCNYTVSVLTNITHEHLDYHKTYSEYLKVKTRLLTRGKYAVVNADDGSFLEVSKTLANNVGIKKILYGLKSKADVFAFDIDYLPSGTSFNCVIGGDCGAEENFRFNTNLLGDYNVQNFLAAIAVAKIFSVQNETIQKAFDKFFGLTGRFELINAGQDFTVVVDFAHTPNAMEKVLRTVRGFNKGRIITVFGCAGLRDRTKRPLMGEISAKLSDITVLTAEDPRTEDVNDIIEQIFQGSQKVGVVEGENVFKIADRKKAIDFAISEFARRGDLVLITGKGHEKSMCYGRVEYPWSDQGAAMSAIKERLARVKA